MPSRSTRPTLVRLALAAVAGMGVALPLLVSPGPAAASGAGGGSATTVPTDAALAAGWLAGERDASGAVPGPFDGTDWGLTVDTLWALRAGGASTADLQRTWAAVAAHAGDLAGPPSWSTDPTLRYGGGTAKLLVAAQSVGVDPRSVDVGDPATDLVTATLDRVATAGTQVGRIEDSPSAGFDSTNVFSQALAVIGLSDADVASSPSASTLGAAVDFLQSQQCAPGWFRVFYDDDRTCDAALARGDASADVDGTAMAVQALVAAHDAGVATRPGALDAGVAWLVSAQHADGSFGGGSSTSAANANSTGLAAVALTLGGRTAQADRARSWVAGLQLTAGTGPLAAERGAIAYDATALADARTSGLDTQRDQWRRTTAQAVFALQPVALARLNDLPAGIGVPTPPSPPTTAATPTTTTGPPVTASPSPSGRVTASVTPGASTSTDPPAASTGSSAGSSAGLGDPSVGDDSAGPGRLGGSGPLPTGPVPPTGTTDTTDTTATASPAPTPVTDPTAPPVASAALRETAASSPWRSPLVGAAAAGILLGLLVVTRPWRLLAGRSR